MTHHTYSASYRLGFHAIGGEIITHQDIYHEAKGKVSLSLDSRGIFLPLDHLLHQLDVVIKKSTLSNSPDRPRSLNLFVEVDVSVTFNDKFKTPKGFTLI